jgi:hypothetical protein
VALLLLKSCYAKYCILGEASCGLCVCIYIYIKNNEALVYITCSKTPLPHLLFLQ